MVLDTEEHVIALVDRAGFVVEEEAPWFTHHLLDLAELPPGSTWRATRFATSSRTRPRRGRPATASAWSATSKVSTGAYVRLMRTPPYRHDLDWVAVDASGRMVASVCVWLDGDTGVALVEPVGCVPEHRGRGLAGAVSAAALSAARDAGATTGLVCPRGDDGYPVPMRVYQRLGFQPGPRTITLVRPALAG